MFTPIGQTTTGCELVVLEDKRLALVLPVEPNHVTASGNPAWKLASRKFDAITHEGVTYTLTGFPMLVKTTAADKAARTVAKLEAKLAEAKAAVAAIPTSAKAPNVILVEASA